MSKKLPPEELERSFKEKLNRHKHNQIRGQLCSMNSILRGITETECLTQDAKDRAALMLELLRGLRQMAEVRVNIDGTHRDLTLDDHKRPAV